MNELLNELFRLASLKDFEFIYQSEGESNDINIDFDNKTIVVIISDAEDLEIIKKLKDSIQQLKERLY